MSKPTIQNQPGQNQPGKAPVSHRRSPLFILLAVVMAFALFGAACGSDGDETVEPDGDITNGSAATEEPFDDGNTDDAATEAPAPTFSIGLVTDTGKVDDKSFNQSAWEGVVEAADGLSDEGVDVDFTFIETEAAKDYETNIGLFVEAQTNVIVTVGFGLGEATLVAAEANPDILFIGVDQFVGVDLPNLAGLIFEEDKSGFLAGALAGLLTKTNKIGAVLGTDLVPPVVAFKEGWENGARYTNPAVEVITSYHPGGLDTAFSDPEWGATTARQALDQGADIIFGAGGSTGNGALVEVASEPGALCVGVDTDQWFTVQEARPCLVTSAMKLITPGVSEIIWMAYDGVFTPGNVVGNVGLSEFYDFDPIVTDEIRATLAEVDAGLANGSISTGYPAE